MSGGPVKGTGRGKGAGNKEMRKLFKQVKRAGGRVEKTGSHWKVIGPRGFAIVPSTASDHRAMSNMRATIRREAGLDLPPREGLDPPAGPP